MDYYEIQISFQFEKQTSLSPKFQYNINSEESMCCMKDKIEYINYMHNYF